MLARRNPANQIAIAVEQRFHDPFAHWEHVRRLIHAVMDNDFRDAHWLLCPGVSINNGSAHCVDSVAAVRG
jgi:hypothetical protein